MKNRYLAVLLMCCFLPQATAGEKKEDASAWRSSEIVIDGSEQEWVGTFAYLEKEKIAYAIKNDSSHLYLCIKFEPEIRRQALLFGFTVWLDPTGKNKRELGLRFPIGMQYFDLKGMPMAPRATSADEGKAEMRKRAAIMLREIDILESNRNIRNRLPVVNAEGPQAAASDSAELLLELKIPLYSSIDHPYALDAKLDRPFSLGFEMGELDREKMRERMMGSGGGPHSGMPPGGGSGRFGGGMRGGRPGGGMSPGSEGMPKPFKVWLLVKLATDLSVNQ